MTEVTLRKAALDALHRLARQNDEDYREVRGELVRLAQEVGELREALEKQGSAFLRSDFHPHPEDWFNAVEELLVEVPATREEEEDGMIPNGTVMVWRWSPRAVQSRLASLVRESRTQ